MTRRVAELTASVCRVPLKRPVRHASHRRTETDNVVVRCRLDDGTEGFGEGVPREYVTGESADSALDLLRASDLGSQLEPCADFAAAVALAGRVRPRPVPGDDRDCGGNAARCAVELALLDAFGRAFGRPVSAATPLAAPDLYEPRAVVRYSDAIMSADGLKLNVRSWVTRVYGFRQVKLKVGIPGQDDVGRLGKLRRRVGAGVEVRVDANEAWPAAAAADRIRELEPFAVASVEQPVPHAEVAGLAAVRRAVKTPVMLDESLCSEADAERAAAGGWCDLFNLRLSKCGGFLQTLRLAQFARRHGLGYQLGCQVGETAILSAAGRHFAASVAGVRAVEGSYDRHLVRERLATEDVTFGRGGKAPALAGPGLGVTIDPAAVARVAVRTDVLVG